MRRVGLIGGTFDPIHYGHLVIAEEVRVSLGLAEIVFVPAGQPPHKPERGITPARHRLAMLERAIATNAYFTISHVELKRSGPSYTVETLRMLREEWGTHTAIYFIIGQDENLLTWHDPAGILEQLTYLVIAQRPGYSEDHDDNKELRARFPYIEERLLSVTVPQLRISASDVRLRVATGMPIKYQIPESVEEYIVQHGLYPA